MTAANILCDSKEQRTTKISTGRRKRPSSVLAAPLLGLIIAAITRTSSAFVSPHPSTTPLSFGSISSSYTHHHDHSSQSHNKRRIDKGRIRTTSRHVSLEPIESEELTTATEVTHHRNGSTRPSTSNSNSNATLSDIPTPKGEEVVIPMEDTGEHQHHNMELSVRMGEDVEELAHLLSHDEEEVDLLPLLSPSVPVSYDQQGLVQAEAFTPNYQIATLETNGSTTTTTNTLSTPNNEPDYPPFIQFLYQKDTNGQTLASKLVNFALLALSFGYVFASVFYIDKGMTRGWSPGEITMRIPLDTWASYENSLSEKPVATKTIINIVIYLLGDWLSQTLFTGKNVLDFDAGRTLKNGFVGMCFGPAVHEYYEFSDWIFPVEGVTMGVTNRAFKILMDQTVYLSVKCSIYILAIGILNGDGVGNSSENVKNRIKPIMFAAWKFWPLVHCVTYGLIPARHRILWVNSVDLVWNAILASKARDGVDEDGEEENNGNSIVVEASLAEGMDREEASGGTTPEVVIAGGTRA
mmetsp:Transcript_10789/g.19946  ORF Transcript_10789/g.19946 Transcript_10789/m.19946 type:complete len:523 (+) Transcript_10789:408-1976(+)|eukprot:CAMPEP_0201652182 /NCGR_PEP_ID=MMETSP0493-20130528/44345_1 /ASSEMBLY_ACC=CAM_ASM_000838 /TAXON_ID=420259 /ORGANISM="Thalassiosira gravida, Strain GMp14c1" /LENGTH=522 /DNA_ID=CAMNT_0048128695 /DNA_START=120 /DNA_END=1688 /DNA_ORIENTATION=-